MGQYVACLTPNARVSPGERAAFYDLYDKGCAVEDIAQRALTLSQLEKVLAHIGRRCEAERWKGLRFGDVDGYEVVPAEQRKEGAAGTEVFLTADRVNLYDTNTHVIMPATESRRCSLMEVMAKGKQKPVWFVSHWWGESVNDFVTCLRQHAKDRGLGTWSGMASATGQLSQSDPHFQQRDFAPSQRACYWVCAYANNQHALDAAVPTDPRETSFYRAMCLAEGTVSVVDKGGVCFTRVWCCFEVYTSLMGQASQQGYKYDIYTVCKSMFGAAAGLVDGFTVYDQRGGADLAQQYKSAREALFPAALVEISLQVSLQLGLASVECDRRHILNAITGNANLEAEPAPEHPNYTEANEVLRGKLASSTPALCLLGSERLRSLCLAALLRSKGVTAIAANFGMDDRLTAENLRAFIEALPAGVTHLRLGEIDMFVEPLPYDELDALPDLQMLELYHCNGFTLENFNAGERTWTREESSKPNTVIMRPERATQDL